MGNFNSQYFEDIFEESDFVHENSACKLTGRVTTSNENSVCTPKCKTLDCDPRSPTEGITRTPIEVLSVSPVQKTNSEKESQITTCASQCTPSLPRILKRCTRESDPRSPAFGSSFVRTPIQFPSADYLEHKETDRKSSPDVVIASKNNEDLGEKESVQSPQDEGPEIEAVEPDAKDLVNQTNDEVVTQCTSLCNYMAPLKVASVEKETLNSSKYLGETPKSQDKLDYKEPNKENTSSLKKVLATPEYKTENAVKPKVRTPLSTLCANNSPLKILRDKQSIRVNKNFSSGFTQSTQLVHSVENK